MIVVLLFMFPFKKIVNRDIYIVSSLETLILREDDKLRLKSGLMIF